jgi:hypothetical protein
MSNEELDSILNEIKELQSDFLKVGEEISLAYNQSMYALDLLVIAVLNRAFKVSDAFISLVKERNYISAVPLIRLHLDNYLRFFASTLVSEPHDFALRIFSGKQVNKMKDRKNNKMHDSYLCQKCSEIYPWVEKVYKNLSGFIHLSEKHFYHAIKAEEGNKERILIMTIGGEDQTPIERYMEISRCFKEISKIVISIMKDWCKFKNNPNLARTPNNTLMWHLTRCEAKEHPFITQ